VAYETDTIRCDLRLDASQESVVPSWKIGVTDASGEQSHTEISHGADLAPRDLLRRLSPIVGPDAARHLVRLAVESSATQDHETVGSKRGVPRSKRRDGRSTSPAQAS